MSNPLALRAAGRKLDDARAVLEEFVRAFCLGRFKQASEHCAQPFLWYARVFDRVSWIASSENSLRSAVPMSFGSPRQIALEAITQVGLDPATLFDGPVSASASVFLVDVERLGRKLTIGAVIDKSHAGRLSIARVFDPDRFARSVLSRGNG
jgi:hypothetical protein